ncbi:MAG: bifunctional folylpolyglutamate synthase/dihydrofolate synthase, partial [Candidatus Limnocylindrales bacterium]
MPGYAATVAALQARGRFGIHLGLSRTRALLRALGRPELALRGALIGGTNGKGSVQAIVAAVLGEAGLRVGQTPKPHLVTYRERLVVDGRPIAADEFSGLLDEVLAVADTLAPRLGPPTEFEVLTAAAFAWFARRAVDLAVVEVGLGGRLDATNAWDGGVAAITNVEWDHMDRLGPTLAAIGHEKAAIIKRGDRAVTAATGPGLTQIRRRAGRLGVPLRVVQPLAVLGMARDGLRL